MVGLIRISGFVGVSSVAVSLSALRLSSQGFDHCHQSVVGTIAHTFQDLQTEKPIAFRICCLRFKFTDVRRYEACIPIQNACAFNCASYGSIQFKTYMTRTGRGLFVVTQ